MIMGFWRVFLQTVCSSAHGSRIGDQSTETEESTTTTTTTTETGFNRARAVEIGRVVGPYMAWQDRTLFVNEEPPGH